MSNNMTETPIKSARASQLTIVTPELAKAHPELLAFYDETLFDTKGKALPANAELKRDIKERGVDQAVTATVLKVDDKVMVVVVMGRERTRCVQELEAEGWVNPSPLVSPGTVGGIPVVIRQFTPEEAAIARISENTLRKKYTWIQMARAAHYLAQGLGMSQSKIGQALGMTDANVNILLTTLNKTTPAVLQAVAKGQISPTTAYQYTKKEYRNEKGEPDADKINAQLKADLSEAKATGAKVTVATAGSGGGKLNNKKNQSLPMSHIRQIAAAAGTPRQVALTLRYITGELSLAEVHKLAANDGFDFTWLQPVVLTKEAKKAAKKGADKAKEEVKAVEKKKFQAVTTEDLSSIFPE